MEYREAIELAKAGKSEGYDFLYEKTYSSKYYLALKYMKNEEAAKDVMQDAYIRAFSKLDTLDEPEAFAGWLGTIVANTAKNALKKQSPMLFSDVAVDSENEEFEFEIEDEDISHQPELAYTQKETTELVHLMLESLTEEQKMSIFMFYIEGLSIKEIAESMECSENTVKSRLNYGRKNLKIKGEELKKKGYKLYGVSMLPLLVHLMSKEQEVLAATSQLTPAMSGAALVQASGSAGVAAGEVVKSGIMHTLAGKLAVAGVSVCIVAGGIVAAVNGGDKENEEQVTMESSTDEKTEETIENATEEATTLPDYKYEVGEEFTVDNITYLVTETGKVTLKRIGENISGDIVIPSEVEYYKVTKIGNDAFSNSPITSLVIPGTVTELAENAVYSCDKLEKVTFEEGTEDLIIGASSFFLCTSLKEVTLPQNVKSIEKNAFALCWELKEISIPEGITRIESNTFSGCSISSVYIHSGIEFIADNAFGGCNIDNIIVDSKNKTYDSRNDCNAIIETDTNRLLAGSNNTIIPEGVTEIVGSSFYNRKTLSLINIPSSVTTIGDMAFLNCYGLDSIIIPESVTNIGKDAFDIETTDENGMYMVVSIKILCKEDSYAYKYVTENDLTYEIIE